MTYTMLDADGRIVGDGAEQRAMSIATTEFAERCFPHEDRSCSLQPSRYKAVAVG
jgi:hypothetical protein